MMTIRQNLDLIIDLCLEGLADFGAVSGGTTLENLRNHRFGMDLDAAVTTPFHGELVHDL